MNSFRELLESPDVTEEVIRFRGTEWFCPGGNLIYPTGFDEKLGKWIPIFVEIGGERFLYQKDYYGNHIGHFLHSRKFIPLLAEIGGIEWICKPDRFGYQMGCHHMDKESAEFLLKFGGSSWLNQVDNDGKHIGFHCDV